MAEPQKKERMAPIVPKGDSGIEIAISTAFAYRLWKGRPKSGQNTQIMGVPGFAAMVRKIEGHIRNDDPYADYVYLLIEERIQAVAGEIAAERSGIEDFIKSAIPEEMSLPEVGSNAPQKVKVRFTSPLAFRLSYQVISVDQILRRVLLANHVAAMTTQEKHEVIARLSNIIRGVMHMVFLFTPTGVTRDDIAANNAKARKAREVMANSLGELPEDILAGTRRADDAPMLPRARVESIRKILQSEAKAKRSPHLTAADSDPEAGDESPPEGTDVGSEFLAEAQKVIEQDMEKKERPPRPRRPRRKTA